MYVTSHLNFIYHFLLIQQN
uniref:Uncharacterized protein n=1 Tax=Rhizophora mucronata TaxID=61149 RepID=A0A2P2PHJ5_RHIMU